MDISGQIADLEHIDSLDEFGDETQQLDDPAVPFKTDETYEEDLTTEEIGSKDNKIIEALLKQQGINDPGQVLYENEDGEVVEKNFYELPYEDQLNILRNQEDSDISDEERQYLDYARQNNLTLTELIKYYQNQSVEQYIQNQEPTYAVKDFSDEELYVLDLKAKFGETVSDDEIMKQLEKELEIPEMFKKKIDRLRSEYKALEDDERAQTLAQTQDKQQATFKEFSDNLTDMVGTIEDVGGVTLEDDDKNDILRYILEPDVNGITSFQKQMNNPENIFLAAWAITKGEETMNVLKEHYESLLKGSKKTPLKKTDKGTQNTTVVRSKPTEQKHMSIEDLHTFD